MASRAYVNFGSIRKKFASQYWNTRGAIGRSMGLIKSVTGGAQREMVDAFDKHNITQELKGGKGSTNISGTISYSHDSANPNLFTFIGFPDGFDPTVDLRELLNRPISVSHVRSGGGGTQFVHEFNISATSPDEVYAVTPVPANWTKGSWAQAVESGGFLSSTVKHYLAVSGKGRSQGGVQLKVEFSSRGFTPQPYVLAILNDFRDRVQRVISSTRATN